MLKIILHILIIVFLTALTQIGGILYLITTLLIRKTIKRRRLKRIGLFTFIYLISVFFIIPNIAPFFGREKINESEFIQAHSFFYKLANRNYVRPELNSALQNISLGLQKHNEGLKLIYLDANFPFIDNFPLLPHLSHNDGKKIDVSLIYETQDGQTINKKPSISGYGVYESPAKNEYDQISVCKNNGYWQYDIPKYLTFGRINKDIKFSEDGTKTLANLIANQNEIGKLFIEPHLKDRLNLTNGKIRFHGCHAVRHDDHLHFQLK